MTVDEDFWAWVDEAYPDLLNEWAKGMMLTAYRAATERAAGICERVEVKQENDNGAANTGGAAECAAAIRGEGK